MPTGISLHVGVNETDPDCFSLARLNGCVNDAAAMYNIAKSRGFSERRLLTDKDATFSNVVAAILDAAAKLKGEGDVFFFTFAGHGTQVSDTDGELFEFQDEALVLHDRILLDDLLSRCYWPMFKPGVRIIFVTDSCNNGTVAEVAFHQTEVSVSESLTVAGGLLSTTTEVTVTTLETSEAADLMPIRLLPDEVRVGHLDKFPAFYRRLSDTIPAAAEIGASLIHLAACPDSLTTPDGPTHGAFTQALLDVWDNGSFAGNYEEFILRIGERPALAALGGSRPFLEPERGVPLDPPFRHRSPIFSI
jgi:metacaspase-1